MEDKINNHYGIKNPYPERWPDDLHSDDSEPEVLPGLNKRKSRSRYSALNQSSTSRASFVPGAERSKTGVQNLVQSDEVDPLGGSQTVIQVLRQRGLPVEDDLRLRNRFLLSSTTFSPPQFLSQVHNNASTESLLEGLDFLSRSIEQKSASLKVLVESNFERFVRAKATIDNVYKEMRNQGSEPEPPTSASNRRLSHNRNLSKGSIHGRKLSAGMMSPKLGVDSQTTGKRKNALIKESEYGVQPIKTPLQELAMKAEEVWGPALGGREKEASLKAVLACMDKNRPLFEIGSSIRDAIKRKDNEALVEDYSKARKYADDAKSVVDTAVQRGVPMNDMQVHQVIVTARMWADVEEQIETFKKDVWRKLAGTHFSRTAAVEESKPEEHMELISILLELGVDTNPIDVWLISRYDFLKRKIEATFERSKVEIEILRRRLSNGEKRTARQLAASLRSASSDGRVSNTNSLDAPKIIEVWEHIYALMVALLSNQGGILGEVIEFWETSQAFIDGRAQRTLPTGINGASRKHHRLSVVNIKDLTSGAMELVTRMQEELNDFFLGDPPLDVSLLFSPVPDTPDTPKSPSPAGLTPLSASRFRFDPNDIPPPSPREGQSWEKYAFWPPQANSLSGAHYLSKILVLVGTAACEMASLSVVKDGDRSLNQVKTLVNNVRERCLQAILSAWASDSGNCRLLEDWTRSPERPDLTNMPARFMNFEGFLLSNLQKVLYISEATKRPDSPEVIVPPSQKLLQMVRSQFSGSIYKALTCMVENAEKPGTDELVEGDLDSLILTDNVVSTEGNTRSLDATNKKIRVLVTLSNIQNLRNEIIQHLISQFENSFGVKLTDETTQIRDLLVEIDTKQFSSYCSPIIKFLTRTIREGIASPDWEPSTSRPQDARPYIYRTLLALVMVHTEVSTTAAPLTSPILKHLIEAISAVEIEAFKQRPSYSLPALMQATLDVEFLSQTMIAYMSDKASEMQAKVYVALDERTDNDARVKLQSELQEMRNTLKRLRERTRVEYGCFKRERTGKNGTHKARPRSGYGAQGQGQYE
ncbi:putative exocyst complex component sec5 protein [Venturia nashicola]|uniref:Exocyst complex component SEC5 n=1 Tax=Venturia nashicola TaxID=86259 RepID=A0A4Z1PSZ6_9PEZI|nr:putative exocyst complex component sec5 protein [Venturia nashicola]TLD38321.1 putative exocyst complex component sec5 protein [Venturia nashicola]